MIGPFRKVRSLARVKKYVRRSTFIAKAGSVSAFLRTENIAKTAEDLGTAAVSVHRALHTLEETIQCPLFTRKGRQLQPLPTAREFAKYAQDLIARMHEAVEETRRVGGFEQKRMRLGSLYSLSVRTVPNLILGMKYRRQSLNLSL